MNKGMRKQIREIVNLVMDLNDLGENLKVEVGNDNLSIINFKETGSKFNYIGRTIFFTGEYWEIHLQASIDAALLKLRKDLASRR